MEENISPGNAITVYLELYGVQLLCVGQITRTLKRSWPKDQFFGPLCCWSRSVWYFT